MPKVQIFPGFLSFSMLNLCQRWTQGWGQWWARYRSPRQPAGRPNLITSWLWVALLFLLSLCLTVQPVQAETLTDRVAHFPNWQNTAALRPAQGDLVYPDWMAGTWCVTSTLKEMIAPFAPELKTPGFDGNRRYIDRPLNFTVRFVPERPKLKGNLPFGALPEILGQGSIVADRQFNGEQILQAYLAAPDPNSATGDNLTIKRPRLRVQVDRNNPNRQATILPDGRQLLAVVTARGDVTPGPTEFIGSELVTQFFETSIASPSSRANRSIQSRSETTAQPLTTSAAPTSEPTTVATTTMPTSESKPAPIAKAITEPVTDRPTPGTIYLNEVETTTAYHRRSSQRIDADQFTAVYLSPQDPNYFTTRDRPVALYRYQLVLTACEPS